MRPTHDAYSDVPACDEYPRNTKMSARSHTADGSAGSVTTKHIPDHSANRYTVISRYPSDKRSVPVDHRCGVQSILAPAPLLAENSDRHYSCCVSSRAPPPSCISCSTRQNPTRSSSLEALLHYPQKEGRCIRHQPIPPTNTFRGARPGPPSSYFSSPKKILRAPHCATDPRWHKTTNGHMARRPMERDAPFVGSDRTPWLLVGCFGNKRNEGDGFRSPR